MGNLAVKPLYSLEKLIEWKLEDHNQCVSFDLSLYSLEKLIEWKLHKNRSK
ncbi:hypothetical protein C789_953 [Microcystis aeruginosa FACHB-905 = DIANCHI905]|uniref:Uncharacterized protein n=1 Tax=Microcystis aeruginosa PCC 7806SL TaxID=1903187 RepID=A0AB33C0E6_MICA7|nr:hypothetical protein BH695_3771 [Microcystis aeruginosa PCC 7806SL]ELS49242.1 hypothetical protein C789_953 [Microcystis aeruginosa FACHB-905 = DIANCHI905]